MAEQRIDLLINECSALQSEMDLSYRNVSPSIIFSNTGRRGGKKYFNLSLVELLQTLKDIQDNLELYLNAAQYVEGDMRDLFSNTLTSQTVNALSTVQTLPLFSLINKILYKTNQLNEDYNDKKLHLSADTIAQAITYIESQIPDNEEYLRSIATEQPIDIGVGKATNKIYYGAPGTGKSHRIDKVTENHSRYVTVFHPDTQYSDLIGALKPVTVDVNGEKKISYKFRAGPFTKALIEALNDTNKHVFLVIEELNRAPAAAVFGEIFQLLDRNAQGESQYKIEVSDPDMLLHIKEHLNEPDKFHKLYLPSNFSILATMNSSDQSVMPMDTAFKRRWLFEYLPIDFTKAGNGNFEIALSDGEKIEVPWKVFAEVVNDTLSSLQVPEDRLLGHRFVSDDELTSIEEANNTLKGKILVYLWDDVLRHGKRDVIFNTSEVSTFGLLSHKFGEGDPIFSETFETKLQETLNSAQKAQEVAADEQAE